MGKVVTASGGRGMRRASWTFEPWWSKDGHGWGKTETAYVRVECEDGEGRVAWSNPVWVGDYVHGQPSALDVLLGAR